MQKTVDFQHFHVFGGCPGLSMDVPAEPSSSHNCECSRAAGRQEIYSQVTWHQLVSETVVARLGSCVWTDTCVFNRVQDNDNDNDNDTQQRQRQRHTTNQRAASFDSTQKNSPGPDTARIDRLFPLS